MGNYSLFQKVEQCLKLKLKKKHEKKNIYIMKNYQEYLPNHLLCNEEKIALDCGILREKLCVNTLMNTNVISRLNSS